MLQTRVANSDAVPGQKQQQRQQRRAHAHRTAKGAGAAAVACGLCCVALLVAVALFIPGHVVYFSLHNSLQQAKQQQHTPQRPDPRAASLLVSRPTADLRPASVLATSEPRKNGLAVGSALQISTRAAPGGAASRAHRTDPLPESPAAAANPPPSPNQGRDASIRTPLSSQAASARAPAIASPTVAQQRSPPPSTAGTLPVAALAPEARAPLPAETRKASVYDAINPGWTPAQWQRHFVDRKVEGADADGMKIYSLGKTRPWSGDFMEPGAMEAMLAARAYKKEIILTTADGNYLEEVLNLLLDFRGLRMEHSLVFMDSAASCAKAAALHANLGCTWAAFLSADHPQPYWTRIVHMWLMRWFLFNSIARRGYNPLILDTDNSIRMDPYVFLKAPIFRDYSLIVSYDDGVPEINCGAVYGQNVAPDGPVAWITAEVVDRLLRWTENWSWFVKRLNVVKQLEGDTFFRVTFEQSVFRDAACSCMLQKPRFYHSLSPRNMSWPFPYWDPDWRKRHTHACRWWNRTASQAVPREWRPFSKSESERVKYVDLRLPASGGVYPEEWGADPFPPQRGRFSTAFQEWLRRDVPTIWVDVDAPSDPDGKRGRVEKMAQAPMWLLSRWIEIGERLGAWALDPPMGVINHVLVPGGRDNVLKSGIMKIYGWWHWEASVAIHGPGFAPSALKLGPAHNDTVLPKLLAFAPAVDLLFSSRAAVFPAVLASLVKAAILSGRVPVYPDVPCDSPWLAHRTVGERRELQFSNMVDRFVVQHGTRGDLRCYWKAWACKRCHRVGMSGYEFRHALTRLPLHDREPHEGNTVFYHMMPAVRRVVDGTLTVSQLAAQRPAADRPGYKTSHVDLMDSLQALSTRQVVWLGAYFELTDDDATLRLAYNLTQKVQQFAHDVQLCPEC